jgi:6-phosphogluconolactonase
MEGNVPSKLAPPPVLYSFADPDELATALGSFVVNAQTEALKKTSRFKIAISGGSLPKVLGQGLMSRNDVQWDKW